MKHAFRISRHNLNEALTLGIRHVQARTRMTYRDIAQRLGYRTCSTVEQVMARCDALFGPLQLLRASRLMSEHGYDRIADLASAPGKRTVPLPALFSPNGSILDEVSDNTEAIGHAIKAFRQGALDEAEGQAKSAIAALYRLLAEIDARRGLPPTVGLYHGDALPNPQTLTIA